MQGNEEIEMNYNQGWLNYHKVPQFGDEKLLHNLRLYCENFEEGSTIIANAKKELKRALAGMLGMELDTKMLKVTKQTVTEISHKEGFLLKEENSEIHIIGKTEAGILYGVFELIRRIAAGSSLRGMKLIECPKNPLRMLNHWDNSDGSIERGYAGQSFFFENDELLVNDRTVDYARLVASTGINGVVINNVNVHSGTATKLIKEEYHARVKALADIFAGYSIKLFVSINFAAPMEIGGLSTADPCDGKVAEWWEQCVAKLYQNIPQFGGFLVKADSEGRPGPFTYNRTHADGANVLARALKPYGGLLIWRCFVYNCQQDWRDYKTDRARAAYDNFIKLDGLFEENVILQIKNGPMDFQVREPVTPLFGGLKRTNQMLEVQAAQEYTGQQKHVCYLIPMWKEVLSFNTYGEEAAATVADIVSGRTYGQENCGMVAVANTGNDYNWTGHDMAAANLYGFGRLCWNTELTAEEIAKEWIQLTYLWNDKVLKVLLDILMKSWLTYEKYTSPLGIGWMVNPNNHYGPNVDGYEYDRWGTYHRADRNGLGVDRTKAGTGYASQYNEPNSSMYENVESCPEELLLFFHYIRYDHVLKSGKTLIQHIYDTHFEGVEEVEGMLAAFQELRGLIPEDVYVRINERLLIQLESAKEWRDRINTYFYRKSGVEDDKKRLIYK
jgi:alpha-glucuronidase